MAVNLIDDVSFYLIRVNPKLTTNVKLVVDTNYNLYLESFDANPELSKSRYKAFRVSSTSSYEYDLSQFYKNTPINIIFDIKRENNDYNILNDFGKQYEFYYTAGAEYVDALYYQEEFGILAPLWLEKIIPDYFIIFRVDDPTSFINIDTNDENRNYLLANSSNSFWDSFMKKATIIHTYDLTERTEIGKYIRKYRNSKNFPDAPILFNYEKNLPTYWNGIDLKEGGFVSKPEFIYDSFLNRDLTILESEFFLTQGFERNGIACANILNLYFLFDDKDAKDFTINRYFGLYVNEIEEGKFQISGEKMFINSGNDNQFPKLKSSNIIYNDTDDFIQKNEDGILVYIDKNSIQSNYVANIDTNNDNNPDLFHYDFLPTSQDVNTLKSIFYIKDKLNNFYNLKIGDVWEQTGADLRLKTKVINWKNFIGGDKPILTTFSQVTDKKGKACAFIKVNANIPHGDRYITGLINKQTYIFSIENISNGDQITIKDNTGNSFFITVTNTNILNILQDIKTAWENNTNFPFTNYKLSIKNNKLLAVEKKITGIDNDFQILINGNLNNSAYVIKDIGSNFNNLIITADAMSNIPIGQANGLFFNPNGTPEEIARAMAMAFNNIKDRFFDATAINNLVVLVAKNSGSRFNNLCVGRDLNFIGNHTEIIANDNSLNNINHPYFKLYFYSGGNDQPDSRIFIDIERFNDFKQPNRYIKAINKITQEINLTKIKDVTYYIDEPIKDINGHIIGYKNFDKYCTVIIEDDQIPFRDSIKHVYLYELFKVPFGRFSIFPIKDFDVDYLSKEYSQEKELGFEKRYYSQFGSNNYPSHEDIKYFYKNRDFIFLNGQLESESTLNNLNKNSKIDSEYDRLNENYIGELAIHSRIVPYINKWVYRNGKDCRENDYRLTTSEAFGLTNFSPSAQEFVRNPIYFTQEWYYLQNLPLYFAQFNKNELVNNIFSYFPESIDITNNGIYNLNKDYFSEYFIVDYFNYPILDSNGIINSFEKVPIKRQIRYSRFEGGNESNFASTLFRGVKVIVKERVENQIPLNYNLNSIKFKKSNRYNDYKFSAVLIPHIGKYPNDQYEPDRPNFEIQIIENRKFKNIILLIFIKIDDILTYDSLNNYIFIDRSILYALNSKLNTYNYNDYADIILSGAIDMRIGISDFFTKDIKGTKNSKGEFPKFLEEITLNKNGEYNKIIATSGTYTRQFKIQSVLTNDHFKALVILDALGGTINNFQPPFLSQYDVENGLYIYKKGGYMYWDKKLSKLTYAYIANLINNGDPLVKYQTIMEDGSIVNDLFVIELQTAHPIIKPSYLKSEIINNKPIQFSLTKDIGFRLTIKDTASVLPIYRHSGKYQPKFIDLIDFQDPYLLEDYSNTYSRNNQIKNLMKYKNTQFNITNTFGIIKNLYYHKVSDIDKSANLLELSQSKAFKPIYPLVGESAIDKKDFYIFASNWDPGYFDRYISKTDKVPVIGTRSMKEQKSFFGSKIMKIKDDISIETFNSIQAKSELELNEIGKEILKSNNPYHLIYYDTSNQIIIDIYLTKKLIEVLSNSYIKDYFKKFIKSEFSYGLLDTIDDDVVQYIQSNVLLRYKIDLIKLYVYKSKDSNINMPLLNTNISDINKSLAKMVLTQDFNINKLSINNDFDIRIIYNKINGYYYSIAPSIKITKK